MLSDGDDDDYKSYKSCDDNMREMGSLLFVKCLQHTSIAKELTTSTPTDQITKAEPHSGVLL